MHVISGKHVRPMDRDEVLTWAARQSETIVDLGAGDGRFVRYLTRQHPEHGAIGIDLCAANLRHASRIAGNNALFVLADALELPDELCQVATRFTINFPWGSLLQGLLTGHPGLMDGLHMVGMNGAELEIMLNAGALAEDGWALEAGGERVASVLGDAGINVGATSPLSPAELRQWPTTWAKRLAFGRDPRAMRIAGRMARPAVPIAANPGAVAGEKPIRLGCVTVPGWPATCRIVNM